MAGPTMPEVAAREGTDLNRFRQAAKSTSYHRANLFGLIGSIGALLLALSAPVAFFLVPVAGPVLGAAAGAWIFIARVGLDPLRAEWQLKGVCAQEAFDCDVLGIEPNRSLPPPLPPEEIRSAAGELDLGIASDPWYPSSGQDSWPTSVLICQRSNAVWASRQHRSYANLLRSATITWAAVGIILAILHDASLAEYLTTLLLPSLPTLLDATELSCRHFDIAAMRQRINEELEALIVTGGADAAQIRKVQDRLFELRRDSVPVPESFYRHIRDDYERDMHFGAEQMSAAAGGGS